MVVLAAAAFAAQAAGPLGLPPMRVPDSNPMTPQKIALGSRLFNDQRFSSTGDVSCATCHDPQKAFTDSPLKTSQGIRKLAGTRNAPTVVNAAYYPTMFWDGRSPDLEDQALHPFVNPIEMGLKDHAPILAVVRGEPAYVAAFNEVFGVAPLAITMKEVTMAIAAFERTIVSGDSPFDRWYFGGDAQAIGEPARRGFQVFLGDGRCVSCHTIEQDHALFTDGRFHNIGAGISRIQSDVPGLARKFLDAKARGADVDQTVLSDPRASELGRFAVTDGLDDMGSFKTPTLRNIAVTAPYMHDGSLATLAEVVDHYNNGGVLKSGDPVNDFLSGGIRPLNLSEQQKADLVAFMEALTSPQFATPGPTAAGARVATLLASTATPAAAADQPSCNVKAVPPGSAALAAAPAAPPAASTAPAVNAPTQGVSP